MTAFAIRFSPWIRRRTGTDFQQAFSQFDAPGQNVVYADVDGNIGYHATGKIPIRAAGDGSLPENGSDNAHEWTGYIPFDKLPNVFNPPRESLPPRTAGSLPRSIPIPSARSGKLRGGRPEFIACWSRDKKFSAADMLALQADIYSDLDRLFADQICLRDRPRQQALGLAPRRQPKSCGNGMDE